MLSLKPGVIRFRVKWFVAASRVLAGVMAAALFLVGLVAADRTLHESFHHNGKAAANSCILCLFAKGQVDSPEPVNVIAGPVRSVFLPAPLFEVIATQGFTFLASLSRGPPSIPPISPAIA